MYMLSLNLFNKRNLILTIASILLISFLLTKVNVSEVSEALSKADLRLLSIALVFNLLALCFKTIRWRILLQQGGEISFKKLFPIQVSGIAISILSPGRIAEPIKVMLLKERGFRYSFALLTVLWERLLDLIVLFMFSSGIIYLLQEPTKTLVKLLFVSVIIVSIILLFFISSLISFLSRIPLLKFISRLMLFPLRKIIFLKAFSMTLLIWVTEFMTLFCCFQSIGIETNALYLAGAYASSILIGVISFLPAGIGSTEASLLFFLLPLGYSSSILLAAIILTRLASLLFTLFLGFSLALLIRKKEIEIPVE